MSAAGILQLAGKSGGFLRRREASYLADPGDVRVEDRLIRQCGLRPGDVIEGEVRRGRGGGNGTLERVRSVNGVEGDRWLDRPEFTALTAIHPDSPLRLAPDAPSATPAAITNRVIDLIAPIGKGQRAMIVAPAKAGKTMVLQAIAEGVHANHPAAGLFILLVDERPEEVFEMEAAGIGEVVASSFDNPPAQHVEVAELLLERARRRVELGEDVVIIVDSLTRLARAYNSAERGSGRTLSGGLDAQAMERPKRFFGSARQVAAARGGGSLTVIATALVDTGSKMDQLIFEEFKGTGNSELVLSRELAERRVYPAIDLIASGTRKEELLYTEAERRGAQLLRQRIARLTPLEAMNDLLAQLKRYPRNADLIAALGGT
jgi:transcription termination factor Rho